MPSFLHHDHPLRTVMIQARTPERAIELAKRGLDMGADAFGLQVCKLESEYRAPKTVARIIDTMAGKPVYVTNYRHDGKSDDLLAEELLALTDAGATLLDVIGDLFCPTPGELTEDARAIEKQMKLISDIHARGCEVLMSSHILRFAPAERVLTVAAAQAARGADVAKIVTGAETMAEQIENLRITDLLRQNAKTPFLFLSGGECAIHRRLGGMLGCCMYLCVVEHDELATPTQPNIASLDQVHSGFEARKETL